MKTRTKRHPEKYTWAKEWGWTHLTWPEFIKRFPKEAKVYAKNYLEGWAPEEIKEFGGRDHKRWTVLYDDECFVTKDGKPVIFGNITGPGGSLMMMFKDGDWDEVLFDDDGNLEEDE